MSFILLSILICIYTLWFSFLCIKLKVIKANPKKFDTIPGYEKYMRSKWYQPRNKSGGYDSSLNTTLLLAGIFFLIYLPIGFASFLAPQWLSRVYLPQNGPVFYFFPFSIVQGFTFVLLAVFSYCVGIYLCMFSCHPAAIAISLELCLPRSRRSAVWRDMTILVLVVTIILCPFHIMAVLSYGYADSEKLVYHPYFGFREVTIRYEDIEEIEIINENDVEKHCYLSSGTDRFDIARAPAVIGFNKPFSKLKDFVFSQLSPEILKRATID